MIRAIRPLLREVALLYYRRARKEMSPLHADMPLVVLRILDLERERRTTCRV